MAAACAPGGPVAPKDSLVACLVCGSGWLGRCAGPCDVGQLVAQLHAGADAELREHLVQVPLDRARAEEELRADLLICLPVRGEPRDLLLLRGELAACLVTPFAHLLAGREQLAARALGECVGAEANEQ